MVKPEDQVKPEKREAVAVLREKFSAAKGIILADFTGLTVGEVNELRRRCRDAEVEYRVVKNTIARIAVRESNFEDLEAQFDGPVAVALSNVDSIAPARVLADFRKTVEKLTFKGGFVEGRLFSPEQIREIAVLPPREGLLARLIVTLQAPMAQIVWCLDGVLRDLISVIDQASKKPEDSS